MKNEECMCNISMELKLCRLHDGIKVKRLHYLINNKTNLSDLSVSAVELAL